MGHSQQLAAVRQAVYDAFSRASHGQTLQLREAIIIRGGLYCGRRFDAPGGYAIWSAFDGELVVYHLDGSIQCLIAGPSIDQIPRRTAA